MGHAGPLTGSRLLTSAHMTRASMQSVSPVPECHNGGTVGPRWVVGARGTPDRKPTAEPNALFAEPHVQSNRLTRARAGTPNKMPAGPETDSGTARPVCGTAHAIRAEPRALPRNLNRHAILCPSWQWRGTGYRGSPVRTQSVAHLWCDLGRCSRTVVVIKLRRTSAFIRVYDNNSGRSLGRIFLAAPALQSPPLAAAAAAAAAAGRRFLAIRFAVRMGRRGARA